MPGGGISQDGSRWIAPRKKSFFLPVQVLSCLFRKKFLIYLKKAFRKGKLRFHGELKPLADPSAFAALCGEADQRKWVVYVKPPFGGPEQVLKYLARYVQRIALSNSRLLSLENGRVTFAWKDYADRNQSKTITLDAVEFIRRFLLHVLPSGFVRIRHFGFLANRNRAKKAGSVPLLTACPPNRRRAQHRDWRTGATPLPNLQGRLVGLYRNTPGRGNRLCAGAHDRGHLMIDKGTPSTKSRSNSSGPAARREISVRTNGFSAPQTLAPVANHGIGHPPRWEGDLFHRRVASSLATLPTAHPTDCHSIPIDPAPAQFNEFYR